MFHYLRKQRKMRFMGSFIGELENRTVGNRKWKLLSDLTYITDMGFNHIQITAKTGFQHDLASIPRIFYGLIPKTGRYDRAAVIHDWLYVYGECVINGMMTPIDKKFADDVFYDAMLAAGVNRWRAKIMYWAVRVGGKGVWDKHGRS